MCMACSAGTSSNLDGGVNPCTFEASGGATESGMCVASAAYTTATQTLTFDLTSSSVAVEIQLTGATLVTGTFNAESSVKAKGAYTLSGATTQSSWALDRNETGFVDQGAFTLHLTDPGSGIPVSAGESWAQPVGSLDATLEPLTAPGGSAVVQIHADFGTSR